MQTNKSKYKVSNILYRCECGREFDKHQSLNAHFCYCMIHKRAIGKEEKIADSKVRSGDKCNFSKAKLGEDGIQQMQKKSRATVKALFNAGKLHGSFLGRKHTEEELEKIRKGTVKYLETVVGSRPRYNKSAIQVLESIAKEHGWNIQHAENGGEFYTGISYFVDAYNKEKNVVLEYDEPAHYVDADNNLLRQKDLDRQRRIIEHLHCEYWRYNEKTKTLWKVSL